MTNVVEKDGKFFQRRGNGIYLIGARDEYGEPRRRRKPVLVKRISSSGHEEDLWGTPTRERSSSRWGSSEGSLWDNSGGSLWDNSGGSLWDNGGGVNLGQDTEDLFSSSSSLENNSLWDEPTPQEQIDKKEDLSQADCKKKYIPYKFNLEVETPEVMVIDKSISPWTVRLKEDDAVKLIKFQSEEVYVLTEDVSELFVQSIRGEVSIVPNDVPEGLNTLLYHLANEYLVSITFSEFGNFLKDYKTLYNLKLGEDDRAALEKLRDLFSKMFEKDEYKKGDKITILLEKKVLLSNKEQAVVEVESFDTLEYIDIPKDSYLYGMMKECGGLNYFKVKDKTYAIRENKIRIVHIEE